MLHVILVESSKYNSLVDSVQKLRFKYTADLLHDTVLHTLVILLFILTSAKAKALWFYNRRSSCI